MRQRRMSPALRPHNLTRHLSNEQVDTRATRSQLPTAEARRRPNDRRLQSLRSTNLNESPSKCSRASPRKPLPSPRHLRGTRRLWPSHWLLARDAGPNSPPGHSGLVRTNPRRPSRPRKPHINDLVQLTFGFSRGASRSHQAPSAASDGMDSSCRAASSCQRCSASLRAKARRSPDGAYDHRC